jgi:hypothetical protein
MTFLNGAVAEMFVHATESIGMARIRGGGFPQVKLRAPPFSGAVKDAAQGAIHAGDLAQLGYPAPGPSSGAGWSAYTQEGAEGFCFAVYAGWNGDVMAWSIASSREGPDPLKIAQKRVQSALKNGFSRMFS